MKFISEDTVLQWVMQKLKKLQHGRRVKNNQFLAGRNCHVLANKMTQWMMPSGSAHQS